jgi:hypothetical protein
MVINRQACLKQWAFIDEFSAIYQAANQIIAAEMMVIPTMRGKAPRPRRAEDLLQQTTKRNPCQTFMPRGFIVSKGRSHRAGQRHQQIIQGVGFVQALGRNCELASSLLPATG